MEAAATGHDQHTVVSQGGQGSTHLKGDGEGGRVKGGREEDKGMIMSSEDAQRQRPSK